MSSSNSFWRSMERVFLQVQASVRSESERERLIVIAGRPVHVGLTSRGSEFTLASLVFITDGDRSLIYPELIADFNARGLFNGGHRIAVDPLTLTVYMASTYAVASFDRLAGDVLFDRFFAACAACTRWYGDAIFEKEIDSARNLIGSPPAGDHAASRSRA